MKDANNIQIYEKQLTNLISHKEYDFALAMISDYLENESLNSINLYYLGLIHRIKGNYDLSAKYYLQAIEFDNNDFSSHYALGIVYQLNEKYKESITYLNTAAKLRRSWGVYNSIGITFRKMKQHDDALAAYVEALKIIFGSILHNISNVEDNEIYEFRQTKSDIWMQNLMNNIINLTARDGIKEVRFPTGETAMEEYKTRKHKGLLYYDDDKVRCILPNYINYFRSMLEIDLSYAQLRNNMATLYADMGDKKNAKKMFLESIEFIPNGSDYTDPYIGLKNLERDSW